MFIAQCGSPLLLLSIPPVPWGGEERDPVAKRPLPSSSIKVGIKKAVSLSAARIHNLISLLHPKKARDVENDAAQYTEAKMYRRYTLGSCFFALIYER